MVGLLCLDSLVFTAIGLVYLFAPKTGARWLLLTTDTTRAAIDVRATYGGLDLGIGLFLALCIAHPPFRLAGIWVGLLTLSGLLGGRLLGLCLDGTEPFMIRLGVIEGILVGLHTWVLYRA